MSDVEWDAEDFIPPPPAAAVVPNRPTDKWDGEDEEDEIKENWEDDEEERKDNDESGSQAELLSTKKKKKKIADIVAEKEKRKLEEVERRQKEKEAEKKKQTPESVLEEKLRLQKIQEDADLQLATDLLGVKKEKEVKPLDDYDLSTSESLNEFRQAFLRKIKSTEIIEKKPFYVTFLEDLCRDLCENLETDDIKRITTVLNALYNEKVKAMKPTKGKKKGATKAKLNPGSGAIADDFVDSTYGGYDEYDDFI